MVRLVAWRSRHFHQAFLEIGVVLLVGGVELLNFEPLQNSLHDLLASDDFFSVLVLDFALLCVLLAVGDTVGDLQQFFGNLGDGKALAFFDLPR